MNRERVVWAVVQGILPIGMVTVSFHALTSLLWWPAANILAAICGVAAVASVRNMRRAALLCAVATGLYVPSNLFFGILNFANGSIDWIPVSFFSIAVAQGFLAFFAWRWTRPWNAERQAQSSQA